jgi:hypothetical protein
MFRKFFAAVIALMLVVGGLFADEIAAIFKKRRAPLKYLDNLLAPPVQSRKTSGVVPSGQVAKLVVISMACFPSRTFASGRADWAVAAR